MNYRNKIIMVALVSILLIALIYLGVYKKGFVYFTGLTTPYSYFHARSDRNEIPLIFYEQTLPYYIAPINSDSLQNCYGFRVKYGGLEVSYYVLKLYNSVIQDELIRRIGEKRWKEYQYKSDSLSDSAFARFKRKFQ